MSRTKIGSRTKTGTNRTRSGWEGRRKGGEEK